MTPLGKDDEELGELERVAARFLKQNGDRRKAGMHGDDPLAVGDMYAAVASMHVLTHMLLEVWNEATTTVGLDLFQEVLFFRSHHVNM